MSIITIPTPIDKQVTSNALPVIDYNYVHNKPVFGGEFSFNVNAVALSINDPANQPIATNWPNVSQGTTEHIATDMQWRRTFKDDLGQVYTPFVFARGDVYNVSEFPGREYRSGRRTRSPGTWLGWASITATPLSSTRAAFRR